MPSTLSCATRAANKPVTPTPEIRPGTVPAASRSAPQPVAPVPEADPDEPLVRRAQAGDGEAFRSLIERHERRVFGLVIRVLHCDRDLALDVCQEVFLRTYRGLPGFDPASRFTTWLNTIALNFCITEYRKSKALKRARRTLSIDAPIAGTEDLTLQPTARGPSPSDGVHHHELPEEFRHAVLLRDLQGMSYEEIAAILDIPPGTVRSRIHRGRLILQDKLAEFRP
jgi:RNA polymerase sigma-70 factor (ECF subfamily)